MRIIMVGFFVFSYCLDEVVIVNKHQLMNY